MSLLIADQIGKNYQVGEVFIPVVWELRFRTAFIAGARNTEFGEKQNDYRMELRIGYYF